MKHDILSRFIELGEAGDDGGFGDDKSLRDVVLNFVIAGRDTTATTLSWFTHMAMSHPEVAEKLRRELCAFEAERAREEGVTLVLCGGADADDKAFAARVAQFAGLLTYDSLGKLVYLHACVTETLRLYPAVPQVSAPDPTSGPRCNAYVAVRRAQHAVSGPECNAQALARAQDPKGILEDDVLPDGTKVRAGGMVTYVPYSMGRMEYNWGPDAASFRPERWINEDGAFRNASPFKFTAFQAGPRICLGKDSAYLQMKMALAILFRFYSFRLLEGHPVQYRMMTILSMAHGLKVRVSRAV